MNTREPTPYVGRFAPSPTGPLHFGSLVAATASYLQASHHRGRWLVRIEDIDPPREQPGADKLILAALERYGFEWNGTVIYQSRSGLLHQRAVDFLIREGLAYPCSCSRRDLRDAPQGPLGTIYPGTCRKGCTGNEFAVRVRVDDSAVGFADGLQGWYQQKLQSESGDFIILRRDRLMAYHLAVVVDDHAQGVTEIVRGIDLLDSTPRQIHLQRLLGFRTPAYLHIPVVVNPDRQKLSKLTGAAAIAMEHPGPVLVHALQALQQAVPGELARQSLDVIWAWAKEHWDVQRMHGIKSVNEPESSLA